MILWHPTVPDEVRVQFGATVDDWCDKRGYSPECRICLHGPVRSYHISRADIPQHYITLRRSQCVRIAEVGDKFWLIEIPDGADLEVARTWAAESQEARHDL